KNLARERVISYTSAIDRHGLDRFTPRKPGGQSLPRRAGAVPGDGSYVASRPTSGPQARRGVWAVQAQPGRGGRLGRAAPCGLRPKTLADAAVQRPHVVLGWNHKPSGPPREPGLHPALQASN